MDVYGKDGSYKCLCAVCKKDITEDATAKTLQLGYDAVLCNEHYKLVVGLSERIIWGLEDHFENVVNETKER
jgi:hypothetical protein